MMNAVDCEKIKDKYGIERRFIERRSLAVCPVLYSLNPGHLCTNPRFLPCGETICDDCYERISNRARKYKCPICGRLHMGSEVKRIKIGNFCFRDEEAKHISRGTEWDQTDETVRKVFDEKERLEGLIRNFPTEIQILYRRLKAQLNKAAEARIHEIRRLKAEMETRLDEHKKNSLRTSSSNSNADLEDINRQLPGWIDQLNKPYIDDDSLQSLNAEASPYIYSLQVHCNDMSNSFRGSTFEKNNSPAPSDFIGRFTGPFSATVATNLSESEVEVEESGSSPLRSCSIM